MAAESTILKRGRGLKDPDTARAVYELELALERALKRLTAAEKRLTDGGL